MEEVDRSSIIWSTQGGVVQPDLAEELHGLPGYAYKRLPSHTKIHLSLFSFFFFPLKTINTVRCRQCLWLYITKYRQKYASVYPSLSVGCYRSSGLKIAICRREHLVCCSNSCSLCPLEKRKLLAKLCISSPTCCTGLKILGHPLTTSLGLVFLGGVLFSFSKPPLQHVIELPEGAFSEYSVILCHHTDSEKHFYI